MCCNGKIECFIRLGNVQRLLKKKHCISLSSCSKKCLALISTWWPTFCVSLWAKTGSLTLMFNSAIVFDEGFCLDCKTQGGDICCKLSIYALPVRESRLEQQVSSESLKNIWSSSGGKEKQENHPEQTGLSCLWHIHLNESSVWMAALWDHIAELDDVSVVMVYVCVCVYVCVLLHSNKLPNGHWCYFFSALPLCIIT